MSNDEVTKETTGGKSARVCDLGMDAIATLIAAIASDKSISNSYKPELIERLAHAAVAFRNSR